MQKQQQNTGSPASSYTSPGSFHTMVPLSREGSFHSLIPYITQDQQTQDHQTQDQKRRRQQLDKLFEQYKARREQQRRQREQLDKLFEQDKARIESGRKKRKQVDRKYEQYKARKQLPGNDLFHQTQQEKFLKKLNEILERKRQKATKRQLEQKKQQYKNIFGRNYIEPTKDPQYNLSHINKSLNRQGL